MIYTVSAIYRCVKDLNKTGNCSVDFSLFILKSVCVRSSNSFESRKTARENKKKVATKKVVKKRKTTKKRTWKKK